VATIQTLNPTDVIKETFGKINTSVTNLNNAKMEKTADSDLNLNNYSVTGINKIGLRDASTLTISNGAITVTQSNHTVDTEGGAALDELTTINGGNPGDILILRPANSNRDILIKGNGQGNIFTFDRSDILLDTITSVVMLIKVSVGGNWYAIGPSYAVEEYSLPLLAGMVDYNTIDSGYKCAIFRSGKMVTIQFILTKTTGPFASGEQFATIPAGLRPPTRIKFTMSLRNAPDPNSSSSSFVAGIEGTVYPGGSIYVADLGSLSGNRIAGSVTYPIA